MGVLSWFGRRRTTPRPPPEPPLQEDGGVASKVACSAASSSPAGPSALAGLSPRAAADRCGTPFLEAPVKNDSTLTPGSSLPYLPEGDEDAGPFDSPSDDDDDAATAASTAAGGAGLPVVPPYDKAAFCVVTAAAEVATRYVELFGTELHVSVSPCEKVHTHLDLHDPTLAIVRIAGGIDVRLRPQPSSSPSASTTAPSAETSATLGGGAEADPSPQPAAAKPTILRRLLSRFFTPPQAPPPSAAPAAAAAGGPAAGSEAHRGASPAPAEAAATELLFAGMPRSRSCTERRPCDAAAGSEMTERRDDDGGGGGDAPVTRGHASSAPPTSASFASEGPLPQPPQPPAANVQPPSPRHSVIRLCFLGDGAEETAGAGVPGPRSREEEWVDAIRRALACAAPGRDGDATLPGTFFEGVWPASEEEEEAPEEEAEGASEAAAAAASSPSLSRVHSRVSSNRGSCAKTASDESIASSSSFVTFFSSLFGRKKDRKKGAAAAAAAAAAASAATSAASAAAQDGSGGAALRRTATEDQVAAGPPPPLVGDGRRVQARPATPLPPPSPRSAGGGGGGSVSTASLSLATSEQQATPVLGFLSPFGKSRSRRRSAAAGLPLPPPPPPPTPPSWAAFFAATLPQANGPPASDADFHKVRTLGGGSYSSVWKVESTRGEAGGGDGDGKERGAYALKVIRKDLARREEVTALACLQHPFVVRLHTAFETEHDINLLLDYLPGGELFRLVGRHWPSVGCDVIEGSTRFYGAQVSLALAYIHQQGFVYRDLKPENVVLDRGGHAVLVDFGLCKRLTATDAAASPVSLQQPPATAAADTGRKDSFCGTPEYLAPEVLTGHSAVTQAVDFWSLGCLLYFLSTGAPPFTGPHPTHVYTSILEGDVVFPQGFAALPLPGGGDDSAAKMQPQPQTRQRPPPEARDVIVRLLEKTPDTRLRSFAALQAHPFFSGFDWAGAEERRTVPPLRAMLRSEGDAGGAAAAAMAGSCGGSVKTDGVGVLSSPNNSFFNDFSGKYLHSSPPAALAAEGSVVLMDG